MYSYLAVYLTVEQIIAMLHLTFKVSVESNTG